MFSSNQKLEISGVFDQLKSALAFVLDYAEHSNSYLCFQITDDGKFCIGWGDRTSKKPFKGWQDFQFGFDIEIVSKIIIKFLENQKCEDQYEYFDGSSEVGFIMKNIHETFADQWHGIQNPFYGIVSFEPYVNFYSK